MEGLLCVFHFVLPFFLFHLVSCFSICCCFVVVLLFVSLHRVSWETVTGHHTALFGASDSDLSIDRAVTMWLNGGLPASKLVMGLATYGRTWTLSDPASHGIGAPATAAGS